MPRGKETIRTGGQIDPYVQRSIQQSKQQAESRLVAAMQEAGATSRTAMQESGASERAGIQAATQRASMAAQAEQADKRAAEDERARREDREYQRINAEANRKLQKAIADQNIELRKAEMAQDLKASENATDLQMDLALIDVAHKMREGKATRNMLETMTKTFKDQETVKQKKITNYVNAKNETDQTKNIHSKMVTDVGNRLRDDPRMQLDLKKGMPLDVEKLEVERTKSFEAIQDQIALKQSKIILEDCFPDNIHRIDKQLSQEDLSMMDIRTTWSVIEGAIPILSEQIKEAEDEGNELAVGFYKRRRLRLNNIKVSLQGLINSDIPIKNQPNQTVGSVVRDALGPILNLNQGAEINELIESGIDFDAMPDILSGSMEAYAPFDDPGLKTKAGRGFLVGINNLLMNQGLQVE